MIGNLLMKGGETANTDLSLWLNVVFPRRASDEALLGSAGQKKFREVMMIKIECGNCRCDLNTGDLVFCEDCYKDLERQIEELEDENYKLTKEIETFHEQEARDEVKNG